MFMDVMMAKEVEQKVMDVLFVITWGGRTCSKELLETRWYTYTICKCNYCSRDS